MSVAIPTLALISAATRGSGQRLLERRENVVAVCEAGVAYAYLATAGRAADPFIKGPQSRKFWIGATALGILAPCALRAVESRRPGHKSRGLGILASALSLAGKLMLKWAITYAGRTSANDQAASYFHTQPSSSAPGWTGPQAPYFLIVIGAAGSW